MTAEAKQLADRYGGWALITGASSGIGRAMADQVAEQGMPCVILSNEQEPLDRELGLLVSNASFGRTGPFGSDDMATYRRMLAVNADAYVALAHEFVPRMVPTRTGFQDEAGTKVASWAMDPGAAAAGALPQLGKRLVHVAGDVNQILAGSLQRLALEPRVEIASYVLSEKTVRRFADKPPPRRFCLTSLAPWRTG
jgi:NAD(P)-dependent dehydrogenase (short-subunit alcohol dehydrogenase family)